MESSYEVCLEHELLKAGLSVERQKALPVVYDEIKLDARYRIDLLVNNQVILELKAVNEIAPIHTVYRITSLICVDVFGYYMISSVPILAKLINK